MGLFNLKREIHASVEELNNEVVLKRVAEVLTMYNRQSRTAYEAPTEFISQINEAMDQVDIRNCK